MNHEHLNNIPADQADDVDEITTGYGEKVPWYSGQPWIIPKYAQPQRMFSFR
jgi:hypothetical protein